MGLEHIAVLAFLDRRKAEAFVGQPTEVGIERGFTTPSFAFVPREEAECVSRSLGTAEAAFGLRVFRSSGRFAVGAEAPT
jgi:hypothetical protein